MRPKPETSDRIVMRPDPVSDLQIQSVGKFYSGRRFENVKRNFEDSDTAPLKNPVEFDTIGHRT